MMEGSVQIMMDRDTDPGGPKTNRSYGSRSLSTTLSVTYLEGFERYFLSCVCPMVLLGWITTMSKGSLIKIFADNKFVDQKLPNSKNLESLLPYLHHPKKDFERFVLCPLI
jgi:hypothetical protein